MISCNSLQWHHNECNGISNHQPRDRLLNVYSDVHQRKHQSSMLLAFVKGIHRWLVNSPHKGPVMRKMFPFDDIFMILCSCLCHFCTLQISMSQQFPRVFIVKWSQLHLAIHRLLWDIIWSLVTAGVSALCVFMALGHGEALAMGNRSTFSQNLTFRAPQNFWGF